MHEYIHLQLGFAEFDAVVHERNLKELVLSNEDDVVVLGCVEFPRGIRWFGRITRGMEAIQKVSIEVTAVIE
jgi:hypothetical protein